MKQAIEIVSHFWLDKIWINILTVWPLFPGFLFQWFLHMNAKHLCMFSLQTYYMHILGYGISSSQGRAAQRVGYGPPHINCSRRKAASWYKNCFSMRKLVLIFTMLLTFLLQAILILLWLHCMYPWCKMLKFCFSIHQEIPWLNEIQSPPLDLFLKQMNPVHAAKPIFFVTFT